MLLSKITKEEVNQLPVTEFSGEIIVVDTPQKEEKALSELYNAYLVGVDTETRPSFKRGVIHKVSLMQFATDQKCYLFRLNKIGFSEKMIEFLSDKKITKIGLSLRDDFNGLAKQRKFKPEGFVDIQHIAKEYGPGVEPSENFRHPFRPENIEIAAAKQLGKPRADRAATTLRCHRRLGYSANLPKVD